MTHWVGRIVRPLALITAIAAITATSAYPAAAPISDSAISVAVEAVVPPALDYQVIPGVAIAVIRDGHLVFNREYGVRNVAKGEPVTQNTAFEIGSITKQFTAAAILQLKERGKLKLTDRLGKYIPEYPRAKNVTIEQMLHMTSGIPDHINDVPGAVQAISSSEGSLDSVLASIENLPLRHKPGTVSEYSNTNYLLLGTIVARVSHMPYHDYIAKNIFAPTHMVHSAFLKDENALPNMAKGYAVSPTGTLQPVGHIGYGWSGGAGSIVSTTGDMALWDDAFFDGRILSKTDVKLATTPLYINGTSTGYAFGWEDDTVDGLPIISHGGG
ncbi:MAG TPA: serine hydrolase domain-containing protein, partial [Candidatus Baltobacteraceae bacterium]|nr:serine hydrolase domain-containing protein [Candidatus Baltobacteraceae bacterium]